MKIKIFEQRIVCEGIEQSKWFYSFYDSLNKRMRTRICKDCKNYDEAKSYLDGLDSVQDEQYLISNIAKEMFVENGEHLKRLSQFGKKNDITTIRQRKQILNLIVKEFGNFRIDKIRVSDIEKRLLADHRHSGSWKNFYLETFSMIFDETQWKCVRPVARPKFIRFARNSKKTDIFGTDELQKFINEKNWEKERDYVLFLVTASCGLRLGEAIGLRVRQIDCEKSIAVIDGFCKKDGFRTNYNKKGSEKNMKIRIVPVPIETAAVLEEWIHKNRLRNDDFLFTEDGKPLRQDYLRKVFSEVLENAGIQKEGRKLCPHSLRFTFVTRMRRLADIDTVRKIAGHTTEEMTEYYTRFGVDEFFASIQNAIPAVNKIFE